MRAATTANRADGVRAVGAAARSTSSPSPLGHTVEITPLADARRRAHSRSWRLVAKRGIDIVGAIVGLVVSAPILLLLAPAIRLESSGRVFFSQTRIGRNGRTFQCYKLRTMCDDAERQLAENGALRDSYRRHDFKIPAHVDHRVTPLGRFLRITSLDELPQFWNVLRGEMSLVGPRPIVPAELAHYATQRATLLSMRPGLTGAWAVSGRSRVGYPHRAAIELDYVRRWSVHRDITIMLRTVLVVLQRRGAY